MSKEKRNKSSNTDQQRLAEVAAAVKGQTKPKKGRDRKCKWDEASNRLIFLDGGARKMKGLRAAQQYAESRGYTMED